MASRFNVVALRHSLGMSQEKFADLVGVHLRSVQRWEGGEVDPSPMAMKHMRRVVHDAHDTDAAHTAATTPTPSPLGDGR